MLSKAQGEALGQINALVSTKTFDGVDQVKHHLGKGERDHDEVHPARAQTHQPDEQRQAATHRDRCTQTSPGVGDAGPHQHGRGVGAST